MKIEGYIILWERGEMKMNLGGHMWRLQTKLVHDPTGFDAIWGPVPVEHQSLPHPYNLTRGGVKHRTILSRGFPIARCRCAIGPVAGCIFAVTKAEEVPFVCVKLSHLCRARMHEHMMGQFLVANGQSMTKVGIYNRIKMHRLIDR